MGYYDLSEVPHIDLEGIIARWQQNGEKLYDYDMPVMIPVRDLWKHREYTWTREDSRSGHLTIGGKVIDLTGPQKWDALTEELREHGWKKDSPLYFTIGRKGGAKVGEGNHRLAIARGLGIQQIPVSFGFYMSAVTKDPQHEVMNVSPRAVERVLEKEERKPMSEAERAQIEELMDQLGFGKRASSHLPWYHQAPHANSDWVSTLEQIAEREGLEATNPKDALEMYAWDMGYQGLSLPPSSHWLARLSRQLQVNFKKQWQDGADAKEGKRVASRYFKRAFQA